MNQFLIYVTGENETICIEESEQATRVAHEHDLRHIFGDNE